MMRTATGSFYALLVCNGMEKAGANVFSVTCEGNDYIVWCKYCCDLTPDIIDDAISLEYDEHQARVNNQKHAEKP